MFIALVDAETRGGMTSAAALAWFARHEIRLAWREWLAMMTAGRRFRTRSIVIGLVVFVAIMHLPAYAVIGRFADSQAPLDKPTLIVITACAVPGVGPDAVAGDGIGHAGVLRARRSRSDHVVAGDAGECVFGAHRGDRAHRHRDGAAAVRRRSSTFSCSAAGRDGSRPMASSLRSAFRRRRWRLR